VTVLLASQATDASARQRQPIDLIQSSQAEPLPAPPQSAPNPHPALPTSPPLPLSIPDGDPSTLSGMDEKKGDEGTPATVIDAQELESILGKNVTSPAGEDMGRIVDIIVDRNGQVRAAIVDFGGFLGVGTRKIAVDWRLIRFPADGKMDNAVVDLTSNQLRGSPIFKPGEPVVVIGRPVDPSK
jgi:sporulation protein YlmC with PRC-barrel domain